MKQLVSKQRETRGRQSGQPGQKGRRDSERTPSGVCPCVSVWHGGHGVRAAVHQRGAGLHGRHAHAHQAEGKRASVCPSFRLMTRFERRKQPGWEVTVTWMLPMPGRLKNGVPPPQRAKGERTGCLRVVGHVHSFIFAIYSVLAVPHGGVIPILQM